MEFFIVGDNSLRRLEYPVALSVNGISYAAVCPSCKACPASLGGELNLKLDSNRGRLWPDSLGSIKDVSHEAIRRLYISRGAENPAPDRITEDVFLLDDLNVLDLFIVGDDGACGYHALFVGRQPGPLGYCNIAPGPSIVDRAKDFSEGLELMFASHSRIQELRRQR